MTFNPNKHVFKSPKTISVCCDLAEDALHWKEVDVNDSGRTDGKTTHLQFLQQLTALRKPQHSQPHGKPEGGEGEHRK